VLFAVTPAIVSELADKPAKVSEVATSPDNTSPDWDKPDTDKPAGVSGVSVNVSGI